MDRILKRGFFRLARNTLPYSNCRVRVGAVISRKSPISVGFNIIKTHPRFNSDDMDGTSIHAEMNALMRANFEVSGCDIYVYRELASGAPGMARPCDSCLTELKKCGINRIYYTYPYPPYWRMERL